MALETMMCNGASAQSLSFSHSVAKLRYATFHFRLSLKTVKEPLPRLRFCTWAAKRNPKRLKYSSPRFSRGDGLLYIEVDSSGADSWKLEPVINVLKEGAVGVIPTDTVYAIVCDLKNRSAIERLRRIKDIETSKYTFILPASKELPKQCIKYGNTTSKYASRKNIGVRIPDDALCQAILGKMDAPLISTSVKSPKEGEWMIDPVVIADIYEPEGLDFVVDGGIRVADPSTVVDTTGSSPTIIRQGKGPRLDWMVVKGEEDSSTYKEKLLVPHGS